MRHTQVHALLLGAPGGIRRVLEVYVGGVQRLLHLGRERGVSWVELSGHVSTIGSIKSILCLPHTYLGVENLAIVVTNVNLRRGL